MWRQPFPVAGTLDDNLEAGVGQAVRSAVAQDGIVEQAEPLVHGPVAGDDETGWPMTVEDEFVEVGGLLGGEPVQSEGVEDEQIGGQEGPRGAICRVVHPGLGHGLEEVVGVAEAHGVSGADGGIAQRLGEEAFADASGPHQEDMLVLVQEFQGENGVQQT